MTTKKEGCHGSCRFLGSNWRAQDAASVPMAVALERAQHAAVYCALYLCTTQTEEALSDDVLEHASYLEWLVKEAYRRYRS